MFTVTFSERSGSSENDLHDAVAVSRLDRVAHFVVHVWERRERHRSTVALDHGLAGSLELDEAHPRRLGPEFFRGQLYLVPVPVQEHDGTHVEVGHVALLEGDEPPLVWL